MSICIHAGQASANLKHPDLVPPAFIVITIAAVISNRKQPYHGMLIVNHAGLID